MEKFNQIGDLITADQMHSVGVMSRIWHIHSDLLYLEVKNEEFTWDDQEQQLDECLKITGTSRIYAISDGTNVTRVGRESRKWANSPRSIAHLAAVALITPTKASRLVGNTYLTFNRPLHPVKLFNDVQSAYEWIMKIRAKDAKRAAAMRESVDQ